MKIPVINIGDRQRGRVFSQATIHCKPEKYDINKAMHMASSEEFRSIAQSVTNPFGDGTTSEKMIEILKEKLCKPINIEKDFYDIHFEDA